MISPQNLRNFSATNKHEMTRKKGGKPFVLFRVCSRLNLFPLSAMLFCFAFSAGNSFAQTKKPKAPAPKVKIVSKLPKVKQTNEQELKNLLKPNGKPLLVNFWATWCDPCREEFPDLVKIAQDYKDRVDVITVSLDELSEIKGDVPKFLAAMKAEMPAYLLKTADEGAAIAAVSKSWQGGLPFTILYNAAGETIYIKQGKFKTDFLRAEIENVLNSDEEDTIARWEKVFGKFTYEKGRSDAEEDVAAGELAIRSYGLPKFAWLEATERLEKKYGIKTYNFGCEVSDGLLAYARGYNEVSEAAIKKKFGKTADELLAEK